MIIDSEEKSEKKYKFTRKTNSELEKQRKEIEEKYNINLDVLTEKGCKTYRDLRDYFTNICETNCLIFYIGNKYVCCGKPNMEEIEENVGVCCSVTMEPGEVLELIDKLKKILEKYKNE